MLYYIILYYNVLCYTILYYIVLYYMILYYITLHYITLHYNVSLLYYGIFGWLFRYFASRATTRSFICGLYYHFNSPFPFQVVVFVSRDLLKCMLVTLLLAHAMSHEQPPAQPREVCTTRQVESWKRRAEPRHFERSRRPRYSNASHICVCICVYMCISVYIYIYICTQITISLYLYHAISYHIIL